MKIKTSELTGAALDWAVAELRGLNPGPYGAYVPCAGEAHFSELFQPSTDWAQGGPIIEREKIGWWCDDRTGVWGANKQSIPYQQFGPTPLVAAMRCYVASKMGDEIEVPDDLT